MKKMMLMMGLIAISLGQVAFAGEIDIEKRVQKAFEREFTGAANVKWSTFENYFKVDFSFNDVPLIACYNAHGEKLAVMRNIQFSSLPLVLQFNRERLYKNHWVSQVFEMVNEEGTHYFLTLESANETIRLVSHDIDDWEIIRTEEKK